MRPITVRHMFGFLASTDVVWSVYLNLKHDRFIQTTVVTVAITEWLDVAFPTATKRIDFPGFKCNTMRTWGDGVTISHNFTLNHLCLL